MNNNDLIVLLGFGLTAAALAVLVPPNIGTTVRPPWVPILLGIVAAVLGLLAALTVLFR